MLCPHCHAPLADGAKFCRACGQGVTRPCPACQTPQPLHARFCARCGYALAEAATPPAPAEEIRANPETAAAIAEPTSAVVAAPDTKPIPKKSGKAAWIVIGVVVFLFAAVSAYVALRPQAKQATPTTHSAPVSSSVSSPVTMPSAPISVLPSPTSRVLEAQPPAAATPATPEATTPTVAGTPPASAANESSARVEKAPPKKREGPARDPLDAAEDDDDDFTVWGKRDEKARQSPPSQRRTCQGTSGFTSLICKTEGPERFWRCTPDGVNWNSSIPGCARD